MAKPTTARWEQTLIQFEISTGVWSNVCGVMSADIQRTTEKTEVEVPGDCTDLSIPNSTESSIKRLQVAVSADGVWTQEGWGFLGDWYYDGLNRGVRVHHTLATTGQIEFESGQAVLDSLGNPIPLDRGKVAQSLAFTFDGTPALQRAA